MGSLAIDVNEPNILALDLGLTHAKAVLFRPDGSVVERESVPYRTSRPAPDRVEQDPDDWWRALTTAARAISERSAGAMRRVEAVGITGHMHGLILGDADRRPIGPAIVLGDRRATAEATELEERLGQAAVAHTTGATLDPSMPAAELAWIASHEPERLGRAVLATGPKDHLRGRLTGDRLTEPIDASATALYDIRAGRWWPDMLTAGGVRPDLVPDVVPCQTVAGPLLPEPAAALGVRAGVPVVVGAGDDVEILGGGLLEPGEGLEHLGTTGSILAVVAEPIDDPAMALELYPHVLPDRWVVGGSMTTAGAALGWVASFLGFDSVGEMLPVLVETSDRSSEDGSPPLFIASMAGDRCPTRDPEARGAWLGLDATFDRALLARSAFEGVAFALRRILGAIDDLHGPQARIVISAGGADLDPSWLALRASTYGRPLAILDTPEPTALGLATVVAAGVGIHPDVPTAVRAMSRRVREIEPDPDRLASLRSAGDASDRAVEALRTYWPQARPV
jgi:xylulokinase